MKSPLIYLLLLCWVSWINPSYAQTVDDFARLPAIDKPQLSPDGKSIAYVMIHEDLPVIITRDLDANNPKHPVGVVPLHGIHLSRFIWANNDRLLIEARTTVSRPRVGDVNLTRLLSIGRDGKDAVVFDMNPSERGYFLQYPKVVHSLRDDPQHMLMQLDASQERYAAAPVHKVNIYSGEKTLVYGNKRLFWHLVADHAGDIRVAVRYMKGGTERNILYRLKDSDDWQVLQKTRFDDESLIYPVRFDYEDPNILLITSQEFFSEDDDPSESQLYRYDLNKREVVGKHSTPIADNAKAVVEKSFAEVKVELVSAIDPVTIDKGIYRIFSDVVAPQYVLFDIGQKRIDFLGASYPQLDDVQLNAMKTVEYKARDGLKIPAFLTLPNTSADKDKPLLPLIVYPHGGPWSRDNWGFDNYVQFFANEGYAVFQPQFRGSTGLGIAHEQAGYQQWGLGIQNDITDGVKWLVEQQIVDPQRICIVGSSFGGYAAAMGLATTPELYRCGISINGVLDMPHLLGRGRFYMFSSLNRELVNKRRGVKKVSPYHLHKDIKAPLLLIAGEKDTVVEKRHSEKLYKRLKRKKRPVQYLELPNGEHWRTIESNEIKKLRAIQYFLQEHLKPKTASDQAA